MIDFKLVASVVVLEISSFSTLVLQGNSDSVLLAFLLQHAVASGLLALFIWRLIPVKFRYPRWQVLSLLFNFSFFFPLLGLIGIFTAVVLSMFRRRIRTHEPFATLVMPEFVLSLREKEGKFGQGGIKSRLSKLSIPTAQRLQSLLALQGMPAQVSSPLLQNMLGDASDDIRLVAYGLLDSREKIINTEIHREIVNLKTTTGTELRLISLRHLAELHWELVYAGLAQGDLLKHALNQALQYVDESLSLAPEESGMWFLKGRIFLKMKRFDDADQMLEQALVRGLPETRVLPYIVEIAFNLHDFKRVQALLARLTTTQVSPIMQGAISFWVKNSELGKHAIPKRGYL